MVVFARGWKTKRVVLTLNGCRAVSAGSGGASPARVYMQTFLLAATGHANKKGRMAETAG